MSNKYFILRLNFSEKRKILWQTLLKYFFQKYIPVNGNLLELGSGYSDFINLAIAKNKYAVDIWTEAKNNVSRDVIFHCNSITNLDFLENEFFDCIFASNVFEHLTQDEISLSLSQVFLKLKKTGFLIILQPNYKYAYANYFDDYTHKTIWSDESLGDFLALHNFNVLEKYNKFLPLSLKSKFPVWPILIKIYLLLPFKPMGKQMLFVAKKNI